MLNVQPGGVVVFQVQLDFFDQLVFMGTVRVEPEHSRGVGIAGAGDRQLDPVANRCVFDLAHAPDVAGLDVLAQQHFASGNVDNVGHAVFGNLEGLVVGAVFFGLLRHQTHIGHSAHGDRIEIAVGLAEIDHFLVDAGKGALWHDRFGVFRTAIGTPHLAADADHGRHGGIHNHIAG